MTALSHYTVTWTSVVTCQVTVLDLWGHKVKVTATFNDPVTFWGHKLGQIDHKGPRDLRGHKVGHG